MIDQSIIKRVQNAIIFVENNLLEPIEIDTVAEQAFMSKSSFYVLFFELFNTTIKDYIRKRRLANSAYDLIYTKQTILDIALHYQYQSYESYSRSFKKLFGISPTYYRETGIYTLVFPAIQLTYKQLQGGELMINQEMNRDQVRESIKRINIGYLLDVDIDRFGPLNDEYGRSVGDQILIEVQHRIKNALHDHHLDNDVIRMAADEFVLIIKGESEDYAKTLSKRILAKMAQPFEINQKTIHVSVSIGISPFTFEQQEDQVMESANLAMKKAKYNGKNQYYME